MEIYGYRSAINETSVTVTFPNDAGIEESDLTGQTITLTAGETTLTATYKADSLTKDGKATFSLSGDSKLVDATIYTASAKDLTFTNAEFVAKVSPAYVASFEKVTTALTATPKVGENAADGKVSPAIVTFAAMDQYGEEIALSKMETPKVEVTLNGVLPLEETKEAGVKDFKFDKNTGLLTITKTIKETDELSIKLSNTKTVDGKEVVLGSETFDYTVQKAEATKVTSINLNAEKVSLPAKEGTALNVKVLDQFKNEITDADAKAVTFVVNGKIVTPSADSDLIQTSAGKYTFKTTTPGEYNVVVVSANDSKVKASTKITVGAANLAGLIVDKTNADVVTTVGERYNKEDIFVATVKPSEGAALTPENLKFNVTTTSTGLTKDDVTVTAETKTVGTGAEAVEVIVVKANAAKSGTFTVTPYVGESFTAEKVIKGDAITFTTDKNPKVETISAVTFDAKELKAGAEIKKDIVFKNEHGETLLLDSEDANPKVTVSSSNKDVAEGKVKTVTDAETNEKTTELQITGKATPGTTVITVQAGDQVATYTLKFVASKLATVNAGADVSGVVSGDEAAKYNALQFLDQDGVSIGAQAATVTVKDAEGTLVTQTESKKLVTLGEAVKADQDDKDLITSIKTNAVTKFNAIEIKPVGLEKGSYTVTVTSGAGKDAVSDSFTVEVGAERVADTIEVATENDTLVIGGTTEVMITPKDQYGKLVTYADATEINKHIKVAGNNSNVTITDANNNPVKAVTKVELDPTVDDGTETDVVGYKVTVTGATKGATNLKVDVTDGTNTAEGILATATQTINVDTTATLVDTVEIKEKSGTQDAKTGVDLEAVIKDKNGKVVNVNPSSLTWSITGLKDSKGNVLEGNFVADGKGGTFTITSEGDLEDKTVTITSAGKIKNDSSQLGDLTVDVAVKVQTENFKEATTTVTIADADKKYVSGLKVDKVYNGDSTTTEDAVKVEGDGTNATITDDSQIITFTFAGVDQFDEKFAVDNNLVFGKTVATSNADDLTATWSQAENTTTATLTVTAVSADGGEVYVKVGKDTLTLNIDVAGEAKAAIDKANSDLQAAKVEAGKLSASNYTNASWALLTAALAKDEKTTAEKNEKTAAINDAIENTLVEQGEGTTKLQLADGKTEGDLIFKVYGIKSGNAEAKLTKTQLADAFKNADIEDLKAIAQVQIDGTGGEGLELDTQAAALKAVSILTAGITVDNGVLNIPSEYTGIFSEEDFDVIKTTPTDYNISVYYAGATKSADRLAKITINKTNGVKFTEVKTAK